MPVNNLSVAALAMGLGKPAFGWIISIFPVHTL
jgi:hypothetical protein